jgi:RNA polymerase sigma-70 factor (ECF subfamily)
MFDPARWRVVRKYCAPYSWVRETRPGVKVKDATAATGLSAGLSLSPEDCIAEVAQNQSRAAFATLFNSYGPKLKTYFLRKGVAGGAAEDLVQEVMLLVWTKARQFDPSRASASAWVYTIARNRRVDLFRRERSSGELRLDPVPESERTPEDQLGVAQTEHRLRGALSALPADQAELVRLSFYDERSHAEIASRLRLPLGTVKSRLRRAAAQLRVALVGSY